MGLFLAINKKLGIKLQGNRVHSKSLRGMNTRFENIDFEVDIPSNWNSVFIILYSLIPVVLIPFGLFCSCVLLASIPPSVTNTDYYRAFGLDIEAIVWIVLISFTMLCIIWALFSWIISKTVKSIRMVRRYALESRTTFYDSRNPVLFLRSFAAEIEENVDRTDQRTPEELLVNVLNNLGPVITVGIPENEGIPVLGAKRVYLNQDWKQNVLKFCSISSLVVMDADTTSGVSWELSNIRNIMNPRRFIISFLSKQESPDYSTANPLFDTRSFEKFYGKFSGLFFGAFNRSLPDYDPNIFFICFDDDWNPYPIKILPKSNKSILKFSTALRQRRKYISILQISQALRSTFSNLNNLMNKR